MPPRENSISLRRDRFYLFLPGALDNHIEKRTQAMSKFKGFSLTGTFSRIPSGFFKQLLGEMDDLDELKVTLFALWRIWEKETGEQFLSEQDFTACVADPKSALSRAVKRGSLLSASSATVDRKNEKQEQTVYFINSLRGRAARIAYLNDYQGITSGETASEEAGHPNIFKVYEQNIGPLTPLVADMLQDAERSHPAGWVEEALAIAVKNNKRNWKYVEAILRRWKEEGHGKKQAGRNAEKDGRQYVEGEYADYIEH
jgi:DNA replication protein